jgi:hypothetical protein
VNSPGPVLVVEVDALLFAPVLLFVFELFVVPNLQPSTTQRKRPTASQAEWTFITEPPGKQNI